MKSKNPRQPSRAAEPDFFSKQVSSARRFCLNLNPSPKRPLTVMCGGSEHCNPDYSLKRGSFPFYTLEYVLGGLGHLKLNGESHELRPGLLFSYGPGDRHEISTDPAAPMVKYFVDFAGTRALPLLKSCHVAPGRDILQILPANEIQPIFDELIRNGLRGTDHAPMLCMELLKCLGLKIAESRARLDGAGALSFTTYQQCEEYLQKNFLRIANLKAMAAQCHLHPVYLCRLFERYGNQSPYQALLRLKMNYAAGLLQKPGATVKQVAEQVGFSDPFHFSRTFKSVLGLAPKMLRKRY